MKMNNKIIFGIGYGYIIIAILNVLNIMAISKTNMDKLNIIAFMFALGEFLNNGGKILYIVVSKVLYVKLLH